MNLLKVTVKKKTPRTNLLPSTYRVYHLSLREPYYSIVSLLENIFSSPVSKRFIHFLKRKNGRNKNNEKNKINQ